MSRHYVITISRQFGTGGRAIGKALGAALGVPVYDRELLEEAGRRRWRLCVRTRGCAL